MPKSDEVYQKPSKYDESNDVQKTYHWLCSTLKPTFQKYNFIPSSAGRIRLIFKVGFHLIEELSRREVANHQLKFRESPTISPTEGPLNFSLKVPNSRLTRG